MALLHAYLDDFQLVHVSVSKMYYDGICTEFSVWQNDTQIPSTILSQQDLEQSIEYDIALEEPTTFGQRWTLWEGRGNHIPIEARWVVRKPEFEECFFYDGPLGANYHPRYTDFFVWAPTAISVSLILYEELVRILPMERKEKGVYQLRVKGNLLGTSYRYLITRSEEVVETIDPYGLSSTTNGERSVVIDLEKGRIQKNSFEGTNHPIIYECSIRDMTSKEEENAFPGTFLGMMESSSIAYLKELGITHVQFQPVQDFASVDERNAKAFYNWGYDPLQYFALEGSYSSHSEDPFCRMKEFGELVQRLHENQIGVVVDVVYNHMYDAKENPFTKCVPYYYFRYENGGLSNGSFCGNDFDSTRKMSRRLILDSLRFFLEFYDVDGFRFDLMGILDIETVKQVEQLVHSMKPNGLVYGEGWDMPTALQEEEKATIPNSYRLDHVGMFNDYFRDTLKGSNGDEQLSQPGYLTGKPEDWMAFCEALSDGAFGGSYLPNQKRINALETHDNATLWDKLSATCVEETEMERIARQKLLLATMLFAQGTPFLHAGMEFCATKQGMTNSYQAGDEINGMDWQRCQVHHSIVEYVSKAIALRKMMDLDPQKGDVYFELRENGVILYRRGSYWVVINPSKVPFTAHFEENAKWIFDENGNAKERQEEEIVPGLCLAVWQIQ